MAAPPRLVARESWDVTLEQRHDERLLDVRTGRRRSLRWSADQAAMAGVTPAPQQLLVAIRGHPDPAGPTIRKIAGGLLVCHHSAVELVDRAGTAGLVERRQDGDDLRAVRGCRTADGADRLARLSALHPEELRRFAPQLEALWDGLDMSLEAASGRVTTTRSWVAWVGQGRPVSAVPGQRCAGDGAVRPCRRPPRTRTRTRRWLASPLPPRPLERSYRVTILDRSTAASR